MSTNLKDFYNFDWAVSRGRVSFIDINIITLIQKIKYTTVLLKYTNKCARDCVSRRYKVTHHNVQEGISIIWTAF